MVGTNATVVITTTMVAISCALMSLRVTPRTSPKRSAVTSVEKERARETMTMPSESMPTKSSPIAVSSRTSVRFETRLTKPLMTSAATKAPMIGLNPQSTASAMPGITPCARASPRNARPRSTTHVPTSEVATTATSPPMSARCINVGSKASMSQSTRVPVDLD